MTKKPGLTRPLLIDTALRLLDEVGLDGLTVRRLAADLKVQSPALYWHIRTKQELLDGMADRMIKDAEMGPPGEDESWQRWLARRARGYRASLLAHRDGARVVASATRLEMDTLLAFDRELGSMVERGFTPGLALRTLTAVTQYVNGFVLQEQAGRRAVSLDEELPATLVAAYREEGGALGERAFEHGLLALVNGTALVLDEP
ncbi:TetR/AcrR family transcriptional regulator C-terminal domain-containing protein [Nonomuraea sp. NBC_01738]|uniref:TetR/AcrR family transcriptional regulator C-terminal domain-containing protein n=1 Tax=Nonomuraea sp. NBC_01738 TaxID=2976003 RepID=UPI002E0FC9E0|nr:TetR/AcrR family transcriptional regulator C-terminal domain-containing protein [Nonomuraea sp. NBC_01738]